MSKPQVFLCHASEDKVAVCDIHSRLAELGFRPWLDKEDLLPGQAWELEIPKAIRSSDFVMIFFSKTSVSKRGYVQKEMKLCLDVLAEFPEDRPFVLPVKIEECQVPQKFAHIQWANLWEEGGFDKVVNTIRRYSGTVVEPSSPPLVMSELRELLVRDALPRYNLDSSYYLRDWNTAFDIWIAIPLGLKKGQHVNEFVMKCENLHDMIYRARRLFSPDKVVTSDREIIAVQTVQFGRIVFVKMAYLIADDREETTWRVELLPIEAERIEDLLELVSPNAVA